MSRYDELFEDATVENSVFADKGALDPLAEPTDVVPRTKQEKSSPVSSPGSRRAISRRQSRCMAHRGPARR